MSMQTMVLMATGLAIMFTASIFTRNENTLALLYSFGFCISGIGFFWKIKEDKDAQSF